MKILTENEALIWLLEGHLKNVHRVLIVKDQPTFERHNRALYHVWNASGGKLNYVNNAANCIFTAQQVRDGKLPPHYRGSIIEYGVLDANTVLGGLLRLANPPTVGTIAAEKIASDDVIY